MLICQKILMLLEVQVGTLTIGNHKTRLAKDAGADMACPMTTGILLKIVAFAAEENRERKYRLACYKRWWQIKEYPDGITLHADLLESEGHTIIKSKNGTKNRLKR